jgi:two-component system chemotaxis response regulator CheB
MQAFDLGAVDFISKDLSYVSTNIKNIKIELIEKVKQIVRSSLIHTRFRMRRLVQSAHHKNIQIKPSHKKVSFEDIMPDFLAVVIGISTGGPQALLKMIPRLPKNFPLGIAIVQHMPPQFTRTLAERLNTISNVVVKEAEKGEHVEPGKVLIAPGGKQMTFCNGNSRIAVEISDEPKDVLYRPSVDIMMTSASAAFKGPLLGVIMTGMGKDGVEGLKLIKSKGGYVISQDEESCIVYGMPRAAVEEGVVDSVLSLDDISLTLDKLAAARTQLQEPIVLPDTL